MTIEAGEKPATSADKKTTWTTAILVGIAVGAGMYSYQNWDIVSTQYLGLPYSCDNMVTELSALPAQNSLMPKLIGIVDRHETSATPERIECSGTGIFANGSRMIVRYRAWRESGQWWLQYQQAG